MLQEEQLAPLQAQTEMQWKNKHMPLRYLEGHAYVEAHSHIPREQQYERVADKGRKRQRAQERRDSLTNEETGRERGGL